MRLLLILLSLLVLANSADALRILQPSSAERTLTAQRVFVGIVSDIEEKTEDVKDHPNSKEATAYSVAVVKIVDPIKGVDKLTHIRIGFILQGDRQPNELEDFGWERPVNLVKGEKYLFIVDKHSSAGFYLSPNRANSPRLTEMAPNTAVVDEAKMAALVLTDPMKALKAEKPQDRALAAMLVLMHYRMADQALTQRGPVIRVPLDAEENAAILKAVAEGDWTTPVCGHIRLSQITEYTHTDGAWKRPVVPAGANADIANQKAFQEWLAGPGAKFQLQKLVATKK